LSERERYAKLRLKQTAHVGGNGVQAALYKWRHHNIAIKNPAYQINELRVVSYAKSSRKYR
jgi:hypothetical protein